MATHSTPPTRRLNVDWTLHDVQHWIPGRPHASHVSSAMHLVLPEGERAFCRVLSAATPLIEDPALLAEVRGFVGQEAQHARAHGKAGTRLLELNRRAAVARRLTECCLWLLFGRGRPSARIVLMWRLALVAAVEHLTSELGVWAMRDARYREHGADPLVSALVSWHGAEEVEHRSVAFDAHAAVQKHGAHATRVVAMLVVAPVALGLWAVVAQLLACGDKSLPIHKRLVTVAHVRRGIADGLTPDAGVMVSGIRQFLRRHYHPSTHVPPDVVAAAEKYLVSDEAQQLLAG
jgi:predicted metal-dependent hydrolase